MRKAALSMLAAGLLLLAGHEMARADDLPLKGSGDEGSISNLKFTGEANTTEIGRGRGWGGYGRGWGGYGRGYYGRGYYGGYGRGYYGYGRYGYGYGYRYPYYSVYRYPYYYGGYGGYGYPYYYGGYGGYGYPYNYGGYGGYGYGSYYPYCYISYPNSNSYGYGPGTGYGPLTSGAVNGGNGPIQLTQFVTTVPSTPSNGSPAVPADGTYPYNGGPQSVVPQPQIMPSPNIDTERSTIPRDGVPVSLPRGMSGEVSSTVYRGAFASTPASTTRTVGQGAPRIAYPAYGEAR